MDSYCLLRKQYPCHPPNPCHPRSYPSRKSILRISLFNRCRGLQPPTGNRLPIPVYRLPIRYTGN